MNAGSRTAAAATALFLLAAFPLPGLSAQDSQAPVLLRLAPPEGQTSRYAMSMQVDMDAPMAPASGPMMTMRMEIGQTVMAVGDDVIRYRQTIDSMTMTSAMPGMGDMMPDLSGTAFTVETDARGQMLGVTGSEGSLEATDARVEALLQGSSYFIFPEEEVSPGDSWTQEVPMDLSMGTGGGSADVAVAYTFVGLEGSVATVSFDGPIDTEVDMGGMAMAVTGALTGTMVVDLDAGRFRSLASEANVDIDMGAMAVKSTTTVTMELLPGS